MNKSSFSCEFLLNLLFPGIGAVRPEWREVDDDVMHNSLVVVDSRAGVEKESGDIIQSGVSQPL